ncbi:MAG TPA: metal ABC transporter permease [Solirubrobacteraceae bacterium]|nr:metal ABC transporter permease [Solirubrobacteraceae bacterium]
MGWLTDPLELEFMQRALLEVALLSAPAGLLGTWIVLRRLAFFTHAAGSATFPGLVVAAPWGIPAQLAAFGAGLLYAGGLSGLVRRSRVGPDAATGLLLVGALAGGTILASDVYEAGGGVDRLLFGTLLGLDDGDLALSAAVAALAVFGTLALGRTWLAAGFDPGSAGTLGVRAAAGDGLLLLVIALAVVAVLPAVGALLVGTLLILPAATARLLGRSVREVQLIAIALALLEGAGGLLIAYHLDLPPGPAIAVLGGAAFALAALARR